MQNFDFLGDDGLVDALLMEAADLMQDFVSYGRAGSIDLLGLPLSASCLAALEARLGQGEVAATVSISGESQTRETAIHGLWWTRHADETGRVVALLIEVAAVPEILRADREDMARGLRRLRGLTNFRLARPAS